MVFSKIIQVRFENRNIDLKITANSYKYRTMSAIPASQERTKDNGR